MPDRSAIFLRDGGSGNPVAADLIDAIEVDQLLDWSQSWQPALRDKLRERGVAALGSWPENWHWNWDDKMAKVEGLLGFRGFSITSGGMTQGLCRVDLNQPARDASQKGKPLVYIDYLETAPWNRPDLGYSPPLLRGVGSALIVAAVALSVEEGFKGRIGLHSLPQADVFYRKIGMTDLGEDKKVENLRYFEMTEAQATIFLEEE